MPGERVQRRLAAILAADVVGYSRLMGANEAGTLAALKTLRAQILDPMIAEFNGRTVKLMGDGMLVEFASAVDAVDCAIRIQNSLNDRSFGLPDEQRLMLRIGVNVGDVILDGDDIYGDGVNVAARLEALAEPGGVCISARVHDFLGSRLDVGFEDLGKQSVKNIAEPVQVFRVCPGGRRAARPPERTETEPTAVKPSIAVLPFTNMSGDAEQEYFADGITEDIITALSRINQFFVIARNSTFQYKGLSPDIRKVATELGVRYVLEGSVRRGGNRLRITGQLIEALSGAHIWADRYDGDLEDVFDLQDRITEAVVGAIEPTIMVAEIERARRQPPDSLAAYDLHLQAMPGLYAMRPEENKKGLDLLHKAIERDPNYPTALASCAWGYEQRLTRGWEPYGERDAATAIDFARRTLATKTDDPRALALAGFVLVMVGRDYDRGLSAVRRAEELNPNLAMVSMYIAVAYIFAGENLDRALGHLEHAIRVSPGDPGAYIFWAMAAFCHFHAGRFDKAVELCRRSVDIYPDWDTTYWVLVSALVRLGRMGEAQKALCTFRTLSPHATATVLRMTLPYRDAAMLEEMVTGLTSAGLPE